MALPNCSLTAVSVMGRHTSFHAAKRVSDSTLRNVSLQTDTVFSETLHHNEMQEEAVARTEEKYTYDYGIQLIPALQVQDEIHI